MYVGVANMGLAQRLYLYRLPGPQITNTRLNGLLKVELQTSRHVDIFTATPAELSWNGLPVSGCAGLELGLIENFTLPWNIKGVRA